VATFVPLIIMALWIGLYPKPFLQILEQPVGHIIATVNPDYKEPGATVNAAAQAAPVAPPASATIPVAHRDRGPEAASPSASIAAVAAATKGTK
jgi:NADH-quinone oxidoreductase subunit M